MEQFFGRIEIHNSNSIQIPCAIGLNSFTVSTFCTVGKSCWFTTDFKLSLPYCNTLYNGRKVFTVIECVQISDVFYVNISMVNSKHTCSPLTFQIFGCLGFQCWWNAKYTFMQSILAVFFAHYYLFIFFFHFPTEK